MRRVRTGFRLSSWLAVFACLGLSSPTCLARIPPTSQGGGPLECRLTGRVDVVGWGFSVEIPKGLVGCLQGPHGILIPLGTRNEDRYVGLGGSCNASFETNIAASIDDRVKKLNEFSPDRKNIRVRERRHLKLCGASAELLVTTYRDTATDARVVEAEVSALSVAVDESGIPRFHQDVVLTTTPEAYEKDRRLFDRIVSSCKVDKPRW